MKSLPASDLVAWLRSGEPGEFFIYDTAEPSAEQPPQWANARERAYAYFLRLFAQLVLEQGLTPTFPSPSASDWRKPLGLNELLVAVWNYDYYQLSVRVVDRGPDDCMVVVARHVLA